LRDPSASVPASVEPEEAARHLVARTQHSGYTAILAYVDRTPEIESALIDLRDAVRARTGMATTLGFGPRYLHSTGQLHKGGPSTGVFLQIVATPDTDLEIPGADFGFARLFAAQSAGDAITLYRRGLSLIRVEAGKDTVGVLRALTRSVSALESTAR
jgi:hypothetical protein